jgi:hypothetical protein
MQTLINIDEKLLAKAAQFVTTQNQSQLIEIALLEFIKNHQSTPKQDVRDLVGKVNLAPDYDYKKLRKEDEHFVKPFDIYKQLDLGESG